MHLLLIHQNFPGQFRDLGPAWLAAGHRITAISNAEAPINDPAWDGLAHYQYSWPDAEDPSPEQRGHTVAELCRQLQSQGLQPDLVIAHSGWGEALQLHTVWPAIPRVVLPELWGSAEALGYGFDPALPSALPNDQPTAAWIAAQNSISRMAIEQASAALVPCIAQKRSFPPNLRQRIAVVPEGLPMQRYSGPPPASVQLGDCVVAPGAPLVTFVSRHLEPLRGLRQALQAWPLVLEQRPDAQLLLVGLEDAGGYGLETPQGPSHMDDALAALPSQVDRNSIRAVGVLDHPNLVQVLQCSACHLALSYPYTLSWSHLEALACAAPVVTNLNSPLSWELEDNVSGLFCDFSDARGLAELILALLENPGLRHRLGQGGQEVAQQRFSQKVALQAFEALFAQLRSP